MACPKCGGKDDGLIYTSNPPQQKCKVCGHMWYMYRLSDEGVEINNLTIKN